VHHTYLGVTGVYITHLGFTGVYITHLRTMLRRELAPAHGPNPDLTVINSVIRRSVPDVGE